jgi:hypothetical protein
MTDQCQHDWRLIEERTLWGDLDAPRDTDRLDTHIARWYCTRCRTIETTESRWPVGEQPLVISPSDAPRYTPPTTDKAD